MDRYFTAKARFIALENGKVHMHKQNGVKIAVPTSTLSDRDLDYVEQVSGQSLGEDRPKTQVAWYKFFSDCGLDQDHCLAYSITLANKRPKEVRLMDMTHGRLRILGLEDIDLSMVMIYLDMKFEHAGNAANDKSLETLNRPSQSINHAESRWLSGFDVVVAGSYLNSFRYRSRDGRLARMKHSPDAFVYFAKLNQGENAIQLFRLSGVSDDQVELIWELAGGRSKGYLDLQDFFVAKHLLCWILSYIKSKHTTSLPTDLLPRLYQQASKMEILLQSEGAAPATDDR